MWVMVGDLKFEYGGCLVSGWCLVVGIRVEVGKHFNDNTARSRFPVLANGYAVKLYDISLCYRSMVGGVVS